MERGERDSHSAQITLFSFPTLSPEELPLLPTKAVSSCEKKHHSSIQYYGELPFYRFTLGGAIISFTSVCFVLQLTPSLALAVAIKRASTSPAAFLCILPFLSSSIPLPLRLASIPSLPLFSSLYKHPTAFTSFYRPFWLARLGRPPPSYGHTRLPLWTSFSPDCHGENEGKLPNFARATRKFSLLPFSGRARRRPDPPTATAKATKATATARCPTAVAQGWQGLRTALTGR